MFKFSKSKIFLTFVVIFGVTVLRFGFAENPIESNQIKQSFLKSFHETGAFPEFITIGERKFKPVYTIDYELEEAILKLLKKYRSDYTSVVVIDNSNGNILSALDMGRYDSKPTRLTSFTPSHPAASIFKIVTAADLLENTHVGNSTQFQFSGKSTTLYKYQLKQDGGRWSKKSDFERAFAKSNNVIFGKAALDNLSPSGLKNMAEKFGFNRDLVNFVQAKPSVFPLASDQYNLAELASGLNVSTMMSPVHGAAIASIIANKGILKKPQLIKQLQGEKGQVVWESSVEQEMVIGTDTANDLKKMMIATIKEGTARRAFKRTSKKLKDLEIGGKTGSITGGEPFGKRDWFVVYSTDGESKGYSLCVMVVNKKKWYVKSSQFAREILEYIWDK